MPDQPSPEPPIPEQPTSEWHPVAEGVELHVLRWAPVGPGDQVPFVLVHGLASNAWLWAGCGDHLAALGHPVVAVDLRGHGRSAKPDDGYDTATVTADLVALLGRLGHERPVVAGQSWGGNVVIELAARAPDLVRGVVAVDGGTIELGDRFDSWAEVESSLRPPPIAGTSAARMLAMMRAAHPDWPHRGIEGAMANFEHLPDGTVRPWLTLERHLQILRGLWEHRPSALFPLLTVPVMFVPADSGMVAWTHDKEAAIEAATGAMPPGLARTEWFRPADHDLHAQFPDRLAALLHEACHDGFFA